ncbi:MAG: YncE family protein [Spirochaetales bacterium]|nr:YncE family protein [Spirochaetales bacterium]
MRRIFVYCVFAGVILSVMFITSCAVEPLPESARRTDQGQVFFYLFCPKKPSFDISFAISGISFMNKDKEWVDVAVEKHINSSELSQRQIKLSEFYLPTGKYERARWTVSDAKLIKDGKTLSLAVPQPGGNHFFDIEFSLFPGESLALFADLDPEQSVFRKYLFMPHMKIREQSIEIRNILAYVTNSDSDCLTVIDRQQDLVVATIVAGHRPKGIVMSPDGFNLYVANSGSNNISVIDTAACREVDTISNFGYSPYELAVSEDGKTLYATNTDSDNVSIIDTVSKVVTGRISVGNRPAGIIADNKRRKVYAANSGSNSVSIIDMNTHTVDSTITVGLNPSGMVIYEDTLYVANSGSNSVGVIEIPSYSVTKTIPVGQRPMYLISGLSGNIYVSNANNNEISFIYADMDMVTKNIPVGDLPLQMVVDSLRKKLYVVNTLSEDVSVVDLTTRKTDAVIQVGKKPHGIVLAK